MTSVGADLPRQMARVARLAVLYAGIENGRFAMAFMLDAIDKAAEALSAQDALACIAAHARLKEFEA